MTNFEDLVMRNELVEYLVKKYLGPDHFRPLKTREDIESFAEWLQQDTDDILILRSDVIKVLKTHLDENTIYNDQFQKLLSDIDYIEPREQIKSEKIKHGEWNYDTVAFYRICPECLCGIRDADAEIFLNPVDYNANYCPNCGTKMDDNKGE